MINPDQLSPEQIRSIRTWAEEGLDLNAIQKRLHEDLDIDRTGRINWDATLGEPTADDLREFETELQSVIRSRMGAM